MEKKLSDRDKQDLAFALILLKDFKADGVNNIYEMDIYKEVVGLAEKIGIKKELDDVLMNPLTDKLKKYRKKKGAIK
jgi:exopolyphosphatase/pppGpp-phosphohydrolase